MGGDKRTKQLRPKELAINTNLDVLLVVDGSKSVAPADFQKEKQLCHAISARAGPNTQLGLVQVGTQSRIECPLTLAKPDLEARVEGMPQLGGNAELAAALALCQAEIGLSKFPQNPKQIWLITDGRFVDPHGTALQAQKLKREYQVTIFAIGISNVTIDTLNRVSSPGCSILMGNADTLIRNVFQGRAGHMQELSVQLGAELEFNTELPLRLGEEAVIRVSIDNVGRRPIPEGSRIIFKDNPYFKEKFGIISETIPVGEQITITPKLVPKIKGNKSNWDTQILNLPEVLDIFVFDADNNEIVCDCSGFFLNHEDFAGDIYAYKPLYNTPRANIITFGPPGSGKSSFVNSVCSAIGDHITVLNVAGATREVVTSTLLQFPLYSIPEFENLNFALYDVPGIDGKNYKGDEMALLMHGLLPADVDFKHLACNYSTIKGRRSPPQEEFLRRAHVVAFFVPQGAASDSGLMASLGVQYYKITVEHKRKAIVVISHADEISGAEERAEVQNDICRQLSIDSSNVFFLENYVDTKIKMFYVDKGVIRVLLAMISRSDDFLTFDRINPTECPFPANTYKALPSDEIPVTYSPKESHKSHQTTQSHTHQTTQSSHQKATWMDYIKKLFGFDRELAEKDREIQRLNNLIATKEHHSNDSQPVASRSSQPPPPIKVPPINVPVFCSKNVDDLPNVLDILNDDEMNHKPTLVFALRRISEEADQSKLAVVLALCATDRVDIVDKELVDNLRAEKGFENVLLIVLRRGNDPTKFKANRDPSINSGVGGRKEIIQLIHFKGSILEDKSNEGGINTFFQLAKQVYNK
jgi:hypothetical protein